MRESPIRVGSGRVASPHVPANIVDMRNPTRVRAAVSVLAAASILALSACAGFRGGWESVPYVGDAPPAFPEAETAYEAQRRMELAFPGITLGVGLGNRLRTYDTQVYLFVLPLSVDPRRVSTQNVGPDTTRVSLRVTAADPGYVFQPQRARLTVEGQTVVGKAGFEFGMWDPAGERVASGGKWDHRPVVDALALTEPGRSYLLSIDFPVKAPSPESKGIVLDVSEALRAPERPALPLIRFAPVRWKEGYT